MKILIKLFVVVFVVFSIQKTKAATIDSWSILSPLSGANLSIDPLWSTSTMFSVTCSRASSTETVNIVMRLQAYAEDGITNKEMCSSVSITTADFTAGATSVTKNFTVALNLSKTYYPNPTTVYLYIKSGVIGAPFTFSSNNYPVVIPIKNNILCCDASFTNVSSAYTITGTTPVGGNATYTYKWQSSNDSLTWDNIETNGRNATYTTPILTQTQYYRRIVRSSSATPSVSPNTSQNIRITVVPARIGVMEEEILTSDISTYPNPFSNTFTVQLNTGDIKSVEICSPDGIILYSSKNESDNQVVIDASSWATGIFYVRIVTIDDKLIVRKIVKN